jgi:hypothetical protein
MKARPSENGEMRHGRSAEEMPHQPRSQFEELVASIDGIVWEASAGELECLPVTTRTRQRS